MKNIEYNIGQYFYMCEHQKNLSLKTIKAYRIDLHQFNNYLVNENLNYKKNTIMKYIMSLHQNYKPKSIKRKIASIKSFTKYLLCEELIQENPFILLSTKIKDSSPLPKTIPFEIIEKIIINSYTQYNISKTPFEKKCSLRNIVILELLFSTGVRVSELVGIDIDSIHFNHQTIKILVKGSKERIIYISNSDVMDFLKKYNSFRPNTTNNAFFTNRINKRLS